MDQYHDKPIRNLYLDAPPPIHHHETRNGRFSIVRTMKYRDTDRCPLDGANQVDEFAANAWRRGHSRREEAKIQSIQLSDSTGHQVALHELSFDLTTFALLDRRTDVMNIYVLSILGFCDNLQLTSYRITDDPFLCDVSAWRRRTESPIQK